MACMDTKFDPERLGLKCGLEIHQQLSGREGKKLFCECPAEIVEGEPDLIIRRKLRVSAGETGMVDLAVTAERAKNKAFAYHAYKSSVCPVELDEEPPHPVNREALDTGVMVAKAFGSTIFPIVQFMRKTVVDGSNVSGFQRTGLFALGGSLPGLPYEIRIQSVNLEEESAKIVSRTSREDTYNLSRLGIPLLEIATAPDIRTPQQAKEVAQQIGMILRSTGRVKRGIGSIRQDLNISIKGGVRNELKGAQDLRMIPTIVEYEARRQSSLLTIREELNGVEIEVEGPRDVTGSFAVSKTAFIRKAVSNGQRAIGYTLVNADGLLGRELCPGFRLGTELAGMAKTWGFGGIIHSDEDMGKYGVADIELEEPFIILIGDQERITRLMDCLLIPRLQQLSRDIPAEVRKAHPDGTTTYMRPLPGAARMYPETDIPLVHTNASGIEAPKLLSEQAEELSQETGLSMDLVKEIISEGLDIRAYKKSHPELSYEFLSSAFVEWPKEIEAKIGPLDDVSGLVESLLDPLSDGNFASSSVKSILEDVAELRRKGEELSVDEIAKKYTKMQDEELEGIIEEIIKRNEGAPLGALMGQVMARVRGRADGKDVMRMLKEKMQ